MKQIEIKYINKRNIKCINKIYKRKKNCLSTRKSPKSQSSVEIHLSSYGWNTLVFTWRKPRTKPVDHLGGKRKRPWLYHGVNTPQKRR